MTYRSQQESDARVYALVRVGVHRMGDPMRMSVQHLGLVLKALTLYQKRLDRLRRD